MKNNSNCDKNRRVNKHFFLSINPSKRQTKNKYVGKSESCQNEHDLID